jgi:hypothetical protein
MRVHVLARLLAVVLLALVSPALARAVRCTTYEEQTLGRLHTFCDDSMRAVSTYNRTLNRVPELSGRGRVR